MARSTFQRASPAPAYCGIRTSKLLPSLCKYTATTSWPTRSIASARLERPRNDVELDQNITSERSASTSNNTWIAETANVRPISHIGVSATSLITSSVSRSLAPNSC